MHLARLELPGSHRWLRRVDFRGPGIHEEEPGARREGGGTRGRNNPEEAGQDGGNGREGGLGKKGRAGQKGGEGEGRAGAGKKRPADPAVGSTRLYPEWRPS